MQIHLGMDIRQRHCPSRHKAAHGRGIWGQTFKSLVKLSNGCSDLHQLWFSLRIHLGMDIGSIQFAPQNTREHGGGGGVQGSHIQKSREAVKRLARLARNLVHVCGFVWEWT